MALARGVLGDPEDMRGLGVRDLLKVPEDDDLPVDGVGLVEGLYGRVSAGRRVRTALCISRATDKASLASSSEGAAGSPG